MNEVPDSSHDDLWEMVEFYVREARLLRSFLEHLRLSTDTEVRRWELQNWRKQVGLQMGNPKDETKEMFEKFRDMSPSERRPIVEKALADGYAFYFGESGR
jgi:hypothetical protein